MAATFVIETGAVVTDANALVSVLQANQIIENYGASTDWPGSSDSEILEKEMAIREATRFLNIGYVWDGYKVDADQTCQFPRYELYDEDGYAIEADIVPEKVKEACTYLALKYIEGDTLLPDFVNDSKVKKTKDVVGPLTEEREYVVGESPEKTYSIVEKLISPFIINGEGFNATDLERA